MKIYGIVASDANGVIGYKDGKLPWNYPEDLKHFKQITVGDVVIMGRKTYESIGKPLPFRYNIVVSNNEAFQAANEDIIVAPSPTDALLLAIQVVNRGAYKNIAIIGGGTIYDQLLDYCSELYLTAIHVPVSPSEDLVYLPNRYKLKLSSYLKAARSTAADFTFFDGIKL